MIIRHGVPLPDVVVRSCLVWEARNASLGVWFHAAQRSVREVGHGGGDERNRVGAMGQSWMLRRVDQRVVG